MNKRFKAWFALGLITLVAGLMLSMTNEVTKDTIEQQKIDAQVQARKDVLPAAETFEAIQMENLAPLTELYAGKAGDEVVGYVGMASPTGYGGPVQVIAGVDAEGRVTGVAVGGSGNIKGSLLASLMLGVFDVAGKYYLPQIGAFVIYAVMVVMLIVRPQGFFGRALTR